MEQAAASLVSPARHEFMPKCPTIVEWDASKSSHAAADRFDQYPTHWRTSVCRGSLFLQPGRCGELPVGFDVMPEERGVARGRSAGDVVIDLLDPRANVAVLQRLVGSRVPAVEHRPRRRGGRG